MEHGRGTIELRLHSGITRNRKINLAKLFRFARGVLVLGRCRQRQRQASEGECQIANPCQSHRGLLPPSYAAPAR
jgi:hypothetical protein